MSQRWVKRPPHFRLECPKCGRPQSEAILVNKKDLRCPCRDSDKGKDKK